MLKLETHLTSIRWLWPLAKRGWKMLQNHGLLHSSSPPPVGPFGGSKMISVYQAFFWKLKGLDKRPGTILTLKNKNPKKMLLKYSEMGSRKILETKIAAQPELGNSILWHYGWEAGLQLFLSPGRYGSKDQRPLVPVKPGPVSNDYGAQIVGGIRDAREGLVQTIGETAHWQKGNLKHVPFKNQTKSSKQDFLQVHLHLFVHHPV